MLRVRSAGIGQPVTLIVIPRVDFCIRLIVLQSGIESYVTGILRNPGNVGDTGGGLAPGNGACNGELSASVRPGAAFDRLPRDNLTRSPPSLRLCRLQCW